MAPVAKTPGVALARVLRGLGLKQGTDFKIMGVRKDGFRIGTRAAIYGTDANQTVADHADEIETAVKADGGWSMQVSIFFAPGGAMWVSINNVDPRVRQTHFLSDAGRPAPAVEDEAPAEQPIIVATEADAIALRAERQAVRRAASEAVTLHPTGTQAVTLADAQADVLRELREAEAVSTPEEARAEAVRRFPRGTAVMWTDGEGTVRHGVVNGLDVGTVTDPGHVNHGRVYVGVDAMPTTIGGLTMRTRLFTDTLTGPDMDAVREALGE